VAHPLLKGNIKLREYQESAVAVAMGQNTLVVLPTGLGKTIIALFVAVQRLDKYPNSKILFLAPTKPLAQQHVASFKKHLNLDDGQFALLTGEEKAENRKKLWQGSKVIFATPQTIENDLITGNINLKDVSFVVFDEAHRAVGEYAYVFIAKKYLEQGKNRLSLALTASPGSSKEKIDAIVRNLNIEDVEIKTDKDHDVRPYVERMNVEWIKIEFPERFKRLRGLMKSAAKDYMAALKQKGYLVGKQMKNLGKRDLLNLQSQLRREMLEGERVGEEISDVAALIKINHGIELLETQGISSLNEYLKRMRTQKSKAVNFLLKRQDIRSAIGLAEIMNSQGAEHPKLDKLKELVRGQLDMKRYSKIIVFTQYRDSVEKILSELGGEKDVAVRKLIGQAVKGKRRGMSQKQQKEMLGEFNNNVFNVLVATSVGEEGLDIDEVDLVVFYEPVPSEIRTIQRRGRTARKKPGRMAVLMTKDTRDEVYFWSSFHKERRMRAAMKQVKRDFADKSPGQSSLKTFVGKTEIKEKGEMVHVYVDTRERNSGIAKKLSEMGANVDIKQLDVADFLVSERVAVERKTCTDFLQSLIDGRLMSQMSEMCRNFGNPLLIIEGNACNIYTERNINPNAIRGAIASIAVKFGIPIIYTTDAEDTAAFIYILAKREQEGKVKEIALRGEKKAMSLNEWQRFVVESLPNVSSVLAKRFLEHFGSVEAVINAQEKELQAVEGVGKKKAARVREIIRAKYENE
jgi:Fanconi anemia group M protein